MNITTTIMNIISNTSIIAKITILISKPSEGSL